MNHQTYHPPLQQIDKEGGRRIKSKGRKKNKRTTDKTTPHEVSTVHLDPPDKALSIKRLKTIP